MEDLAQIFDRVERGNKKMEEFKNECLLRLRAILYGSAELPAKMAASAAQLDSTTASPQQTKKRVKHLSSLNEDDETFAVNVKRTSSSKLLEIADAMEHDEMRTAVLESMPVATPRCVASSANGEETIAPSLDEEHEFVRPKRAAKLKSEKNLKEPALNTKMRRPSRDEQMHNASVSSRSSKQSTVSIKSEDSSVIILPGKIPSMVDLVSDAEPEVVEEVKEKSKSLEGKNERKMRVKIKREKMSLLKAHETEETPPHEGDTTKKMPETLPLPIPMPVKTELSASTIQSTSINTTKSTIVAFAPTKKGKKKKDIVHKPIKVERFSEITPSPISSRTRKGSNGTQSRPQRAASIYEDAVDNLAAVSNEKLADIDLQNIDTPPSRISQVPKEVLAAVSPPAVNETVTFAAPPVAQPNATMLLSAAGDATFTTNPAQTTFQVAPATDNNPNATVTIAKKSGGQDYGDATFNVTQQLPAPPKRSSSKDNQSMVTAKDTSSPHDESLITEDESFEPPTAMLPPQKAPAALKPPTSAKASYKLPTRTHELFNPLVQSPVKKKVEAFENAAVHAAAVAGERKSRRPQRTKENELPAASTQSSSSTTPLIGKLQAPSLSRFLTPTQSSNITPNVTQQTKKLASSASKAMPFPKLSTNLKPTTSSSAKATLSRENSCDDFRRGLAQMAEERKKQREQKHLLAAQQREAKEKERAERMAKVAKEREEKRIKKQMEMEQKKKELEEIQRKLKQNEEPDLLKQALATAKSKAIQEQERELLHQMRAPKAKAPTSVQQAKMRIKYTFEMLHEDDSTDDEEKVTYKRPSPPTWSRNNVRGPVIHMQQSWPTNIIDSFFSVQPLTPDLKLIFPNIDDRYLKRNSSAFWATPPRYSELPKY